MAAETRKSRKTTSQQNITENIKFALAKWSGRIIDRPRRPGKQEVTENLHNHPQELKKTTQ